MALAIAFGWERKPAPSFTAQPQAPAPSHIASQSLRLYEIAWQVSCCGRNGIGECAWLGTQAGAFGWAVNDALLAL